MNYTDQVERRRRRRRRALAILSLGVVCELMRRMRGRSVWMHHYIARRNSLGCHNNLFMELRNENPEKFKRCLRMTPEMFTWLADKIRPLVQRQDTHLRRSIPVEERLSITLRHLATGETQESLSYQFRVGQSTASGIIKEVCRALHSTLKDTYLKFPGSEEEWKSVALEYGIKWNFFNCIGAMDGKHILIEPPVSLVLGTNGRVGDKGVWNKCSMKACLDNNTLNIPPPCPLPRTNDNFPFVIVGDEGFMLTSRVMIPYPKEQLAGRLDRAIFNYRLSRARRCSENAFGLIVNRFQILRSAMRYDPDDARTITLAILALHNLLRSDVVGRTLYSPPEMLDRFYLVGCVRCKQRNPPIRIGAMWNLT